MDRKSPLNLAVLVSGGGTTLQNLIDAIADGRLDARIRIVIGSRPDLGGMERARAAGIEAVVVDRKQFPDVRAFSRQVFWYCNNANVDLVCLAGWLCLLELPYWTPCDDPGRVVAEPYKHRVMNIHPALLPSFGGKGMYGRRVHEAVIAHGCKVSGCTVHLVDATYDTGPIILQRTCPVLDDDTPETLAHRVFEEEKVAYPEAIRLFQEGRLMVEGRRVRILPPPEDS